MYLINYSLFLNEPPSVLYMYIVYIMYNIYIIVQDIIVQVYPVDS